MLLALCADCWVSEAGGGDGIRRPRREIRHTVRSRFVCGKCVSRSGISVSRFGVEFMSD